MTILIFVEGERSVEFVAADFPLAVGVTNGDEIVVGSEAEAAAIAWILAHRDGLSIQPEKSRISLLFNGEPLTQPAWLGHGDEIAIGDVKFSIASQDGTYRLTVADGSGEDSIGPVGTADAPQATGFGTKFNSAHRTSSNRKKFSTPKRIALGVFAVLLLGVAFVVTALPLHLRFTPEADAVTVRGFPLALPVADRYLALPGTYTVEARKDGYKPFQRTISVAHGVNRAFEFSLEKLPGQLRITTPNVEGAKIFIDDVARGTTPAVLDVDAGEHGVRILSERHLPVIRRVDIEGMGRTQEIEIALRPAWGILTISSVPDRASVRLDGKEAGETPLSLEALQGAHEIEVSKAGWKPATRKVEARGGVEEVVATIALERSDGTLALTSEPAGASVLINEQFQGQTPLSLTLVGDRDHRLSIAKAGYESDARNVRVEGGKTDRLAVRLQPEFGTIFLTTNPAGATVTVNGRQSGSATQRLTLQTIPQTIEIAKPGYEPQKVVMTPQKGVAKRVDINLKTVGEALKERVGKGMTTPGGQKLALIFLGSSAQFTVGSPRRDAARRSNEVEYPVELTRSFLISEKEVTNGEYRKFKPAHSSGSHQGASLDEPDKPVVNVLWEDAARYANWLSSQEGLTPAYREQGDKLVPVVPLTNGYRLPTEAEWEFAARYDGGQRSANQPLRFAWGDSMPPPANSGNFAHEGTGLPFAIPGYSDGFAATAPVGKFAPNKSLIYDLSGNVAEWCHDYYDVATPSAAAPRRDPAGPADGRFHVIKGSSWRSGSATELRLSYRDYAEKPRDDLGFRIVKYVDATK